MQGRGRGEEKVGTEERRIRVLEVGLVKRESKCRIRREEEEVEGRGGGGGGRGGRILKSDGRYDEMGSQTWDLMVFLGGKFAML